MSAMIVQDRCWTVPFVAAFTAFFVMIISSSYGLLYVLLMDEFGVSHEQATWPQSIYMIAAHSVGFVLMVLQQKMPVYHMALLGAFLACVGLIASSFAPNIAWMSALVGATYGAGAGLVIMTLSLYTLTYFNRYRATATAFKYTGWAASGIVGPSLLAYLAESYGTLPSLLLVGAIAAHAFPLLMLLNNPRPVTIICTRRKETSNTTVEPSILPNVHDCSQAALPSHWPLRKVANCAKYGAEGKTLPSPFRNVELNIETSKVQDLGSSHSEMVQGHANKAERNTSSSTDINSDQCGGGIHRTKYLMVKAPNLFKHYKAVFLSVTLYALVGCYVAMEFSSSMVETTIVAYGIDKNAGTLKQCNQLQTFVAVGQLAGRLVVPFLSDKIPFSRCPMTAGSLAISAAILVLISFTRQYAALAALTTMLGACQGFLLCVKAVLYADYLGLESLGLACGLQGLGMVPILLSAPAAIGFFRDERGSYDQFYWTLGALNVVSATIVCCIAVTDRQRRKQWSIN